MLGKRKRSSLRFFRFFFFSFFCAGVGVVVWVFRLFAAISGWYRVEMKFWDSWDIIFEKIKGAALMCLLSELAVSCWNQSLQGYAR